MNDPRNFEELRNDTLEVLADHFNVTEPSDIERGQVDAIVRDYINEQNG